MGNEISVDEIIAKYPRLAKYRNNEVGLRALFAQLEGLTKPISAWKDGDQVDDAQVLVFKIIRKSVYVGCSTCHTRAPDGVNAETSFRCSRCNEERVAIALKWYHLLIGDENNIAEGVIPPSKTSVSANVEGFVGKIIKISGTVHQKQSNAKSPTPYDGIPSITIKRYTVLEDVTDMTSTAIGTFEPIKDEEIKELSDKDLTALRLFFSIMDNKVKQDKFNVYIKSKKIDEELIAPYIEIKNGYVSFLPLMKVPAEQTTSEGK